MKQFKYSFLFISTKKHKREPEPETGCKSFTKIWMVHFFTVFSYIDILVLYGVDMSMSISAFVSGGLPSPLEISSNADWSESGGVIIQWQQCSGWIQRNLHTRLIWSSVERKTGDDCAALCAPQPDDSGAGDASVTLPHCFYQSNLQCYCLGLSRLQVTRVLCPLAPDTAALMSRYLNTHFQFTKKYLVRIQASDDWISPWCDNKKLTFQL